MSFVASVGAQTPTAEDPVEALNEIASEVTIYGRFFEGDLTGTPEASTEMPLTVIVQAYELEDADVAEEALPYVEQLMKEELEPIVGQPLESEEVDDLGDNATRSSATIDQNEMSINVSLILVQQDETIYVVGSVVMNGDADQMATDVMEFMLDGEAGDAADVEFNEDGTSTGGYFDVFPAEEDAELVQGLEVTQDMYDGTN